MHLTNLSERSMKTENNFSDRIPPCLTPFDIEKKPEIHLPHLMQTVCLLYQNNKILTITIGVLRSSSFRNNLKCLILSKALDASKKQVYEVL